MANIIDYVKEFGNLSFEEKEFCDVDSLILSQLTYLDYGRIQYDFENKPITLFELYEKNYTEELCENTSAPKENKELFINCCQSQRFSNIIVVSFYEKLELDSQQQFSVCVYKLDPDLYYVGYRGTDATLVGWKEDFNMSYASDVPSQKLAFYFFHAFTQSHKGKYMVGGHSKGGNLAVYSAMFEKDADIVAIYNHDGPGFLDKDEYKDVLDKIHKTIPKTSVVGLLMEKEQSYKIVDSTAFYFFQHDPYTWVIENGQFKSVNEIEPLAIKTKQTIDEWLEKSDRIQRRKVVDSIYSLLDNTEGQTLKDFKNSWKPNAKTVYHNIQSMQKEDVKEIIMALDILQECAKNQLDDFINQIKRNWLHE